MRSAAAIACCRLALTRLSFLAGPYIRNSAAMNDVNSPGVSRPGAICAAAVPQRAGDRRRRRAAPSAAAAATATRVTFMLVRIQRRATPRANFAASRSSAPNALTMRWPANASARDVRHVLQRFLAAPRAVRDALPEAHERIDDERRAGHAHSASRAS